MFWNFQFGKQTKILTRSTCRFLVTLNTAADPFPLPSAPSFGCIHGLPAPSRALPRVPPQAHLLLAAAAPARHVVVLRRRPCGGGGPVEEAAGAAVRCHGHPRQGPVLPPHPRLLPVQYNPRPRPLPTGANPRLFNFGRVCEVVYGCSTK